MRILAIIPAHNEQACIQATVESLVRTCPSVDYLVVNDGSSDDTGAICERLGLNHVSLPVNTGLASAFQAGMKYAWRHGYDAAVQFDADGQHLPEYIPPMADALEREGADVVIASRALAGEAPQGLRGLGSRLIAGLMRLTSGISVTDPTSGMRMYGRNVMGIFARGFDLAPEPDVIALLARRGAVITEIAAHMQERQGGESYLDTSHAIAYMARTCCSILMFQWFR